MKQFTLQIGKTFALTSFCAVAALVATPAQAVVMNFESLALNNASNNPYGDTYTENGFTVSIPNALGSTLSFRGTLSPSYPGSTALYNDTPNKITRLTKVGGGAFDLSSIDLTNLNANQSVAVLFIGKRADNTTISQAFTTDALLSTLETLNFTNFTNLVSVDWAQSPSYHQFDNINVSTAGSTAVPEPVTIVGTLVGGIAALRMRKRLKAAAKNDRA